MSGAAEPTANRAKVDEEEDPLVRRKEELVLMDANARAKGREVEEGLVREAEEKAERLEREANREASSCEKSKRKRLRRNAKKKGERIVREAKERAILESDRTLREARLSFGQELRSVCAKLEAKNEKLLGRLPPEIWQKILDDYLHQNDMLALGMTCRFFRDTTKDLGWEVKADHWYSRLFQLLKSEKEASHTLGWFQWICDTWEILPGIPYCTKRAERTMYEGDLLRYAALQGSVKILRWLVEEKGFELNPETESKENIGLWAAFSGSTEVLEYLRGRGYKFKEACEGAACGGHLGALKYLRGLDPPCRWGTIACSEAAGNGHLEVLKWLRAQNPPCPWDENVCYEAARKGHLEILKWAFSQNPPCWDDEYHACANAAGGGHLEVLKFLRGKEPPCPWSRSECREEASLNGHQHIIDWIDQQEDESDADY